MKGDNDSNSLSLTDVSAAIPSAAASNADDKAGAVEAAKNNVQNLSEQHPPGLEHLAPKVRKRVQALRVIQNERDELQAKFFEEKASLEAKYQKLYEPCYTKRYEIVNGVVEVEGVTDEVVKDEVITEGKGVPDFWLTVLRTDSVVTEEIHHRDEGALQFLKDIKWHRTDEHKGFKLEFFFDPNPYFKNAVLTKTYQMSDSDCDKPILDKAIGTQIEWFPGKCLTHKILKKRAKRGSKSTNPVTKTEPCESFFNFFSPPQMPEVDDDDDMDDCDAEQLENLLEQDYDIGSTIKDKIIPRAVLWFTGEAFEDDEYDVEEDEDAEEEDEDGEDEGKNMG